MARKRGIKSEDSRQQPNVEMIKLEAIFAAQEQEKPEPEIDYRAERLNVIAKFIGDKFIDLVGTSDDYEIFLSELEPMDSTLSSRSIRIQPKPESTTIFLKAQSGSLRFQIASVIRSSFRALVDFELDVFESMYVIDNVISRIQSECEIKYRFVGNELVRIRDEADVYRGGVLSAPKTRLPDSIEEAIQRLRLIFGVSFIRSRVHMELEPLTHGDKVIEVRRRIAEAWRHADYYRAALKYVSDDINEEIEFLKERKQINEAVGSNTAGKPQAPKIKRHPDLTIDRAILLIDAIGGSRLKSADRDKLAEVVAFLTGDSPESVRQRYSALNPENGKYKGNSEGGMKALRDDLERLGHYFDLIGLRGASARLSEYLGIPLTS